ncbi:hypothetical protein SCAR479_09681 [Seiridium cardinale]|uniref:Uncharacterized protein n=1 Tax=Seiridium cardinale TaxID=138064 RepID=A0ABR2XJ89_9PEZI
METQLQNDQVRSQGAGLEHKGIIRVRHPRLASSMDRSGPNFPAYQ